MAIAEPIAPKSPVTPRGPFLPWYRRTEPPKRRTDEVPNAAINLYYAGWLNPYLKRGMQIKRGTSLAINGGPLCMRKGFLRRHRRTHGKWVANERRGA